MKRRFSRLAAVDFLLVAMLLFAVPAGAQSVDDKIKALEEELSSLKSQQIELEEGGDRSSSGVADFQLSSRQWFEHRGGGQVMGCPLFHGDRRAYVI